MNEPLIIEERSLDKGWAPSRVQLMVVKSMSVPFLQSPATEADIEALGFVRRELLDAALARITELEAKQNSDPMQYSVLPRKKKVSNGL